MTEQFNHADKEPQKTTAELLMDEVEAAKNYLVMIGAYLEEQEIATGNYSQPISDKPEYKEAELRLETARVALSKYALNNQ